MSKYWIVPGLKMNSLIIKDFYSHNPRDLMYKIGDYYSLKPELLKSAYRKREYVKAPHIGMWIMYKKFDNLSLSQIGNMYIRDHATVLHAVRSVSNDLDTSKSYRLDFIKLLNYLQIKYNLTDGKFAI